MQCVLVTGGSRGIGRAIVERLAAAGYRVHFAYLSNDAAAAEVVERVAGAGGSAVAHRTDITDIEAVEALMSDIEGEGFYALVNNAAALRDGHFLLMDEERWQAVLETSLSAAYRVTRACIRPMLHAGCGRVINIGSLSGLLGKAGQVNYSAAKGGLHAMAKALARELGRYGITVNTVVPGWIETDLVASMPAARKQKALAEVPLARFGTPAEVAAVVEFLISPAAGYLTGAMIRVDGGLGY
jgi:3-oxoacyl-[acyl-carrier protein] reductase